MDTKLLRVIDANANRVREGMRVAEEITRLILDNPELTSEWKEARHKVTALLAKIPGGSHALLKERDSDSDVGQDLYPEGEGKRTDYRELALVNARRAEEGIRVLEEFAKLIEPGLGREFKNLRFHVYSLEKRTLTTLSCHSERSEESPEILRASPSE